MIITLDIQPDTLVRHVRTGNQYRVVKHTLARQGDGFWVPSINYVPADGSDGDYTRDMPTFNENFELVA